MKTLKMITTGPNKNYKVGDIVTVDDARAAILIKAKAAKEVKDGSVRSQRLQTLR